MIKNCLSRRCLRLVSATWLLCSLFQAPAVVAESDLKFIETDHLRVLYYDPAERYLLPSATQSLLASLQKERELFGYVPNGKVNVLLEDFSDMSRASTLSAPRNRIFWDVAPQSDSYEYTSPGNLFAWLSAHETASLALLDHPSPADARYRGWFHGKVDVDSTHPETLWYHYLTTPRNVTPRWYPQGSAVFAETWMMGGLGRAQGGYDEMVFRAMVRDEAHFYDPLGLVTKGTEVNFQTGADAYLYGTRFINYLALTYDPAHLLDWWSRESSSRADYAEDFTRVFGVSIAAAWQDWILFEHTFQTDNLQAVRQHPLTPIQDVTPRGLGMMSRTHVSPDGSTLYAAIQAPGQVASLVAINRRDGAVTRLQEIIGPAGIQVASLAYDRKGDTLFYTSNNAGHRSIEAFDVRTHRSRRILTRARIGDLAFNDRDRSLWGIRFNHGLAMLVTIPYPYREWKTVQVFQSGERPFDLDISADGQFAALSVSRSGPSLSEPITDVRVLPIGAAEPKDPTADRVFTLAGAVPEGFVFSPDGRYLYGSSYYSGVSNIYRYDLAEQRVEAVTNAEIGFFNPRPVDESHLLVLRFTSQGFVPTVIEVEPRSDLSAVTFLGEQVHARHAELERWVQPMASAMPFEASIVRQGSYRPFREMSVESVIPMVQGYKHAIGAGFAANFSDPMGFDSLTINASYSPDATLPAKERLHVATDFRQGRWTVGAKWNGADFYDIFGPIRRSREGYSGHVGYDRPLVFDPPTTMDVVADVAYYGDLDALPGFQTVRSPSRALSTVSAGIRSTDIRSSPGSVDYEAGREWSVMAHGYGAGGEFTPSLQMEYHLGLPLPIDHSSLWLRTAASVSEGHVDSVLSNVYLGGFGNNYVDSTAYSGAQRYRGALLSSMPGFDIDALRGRTVAKAMLEWCLPPIRFERWGTPGFYTNWARPEVFTSVLETNVDNPQLRSTARNIGAQLDFNITAMHRYPLKLSMGVARGFGGEGQGKTEWMLSLLVL